MKHCLNCRDGEVYCKCEDPMFFSDGFVLGVGLVILAVCSAVLIGAARMLLF